MLRVEATAEEGADLPVSEERIAAVVRWTLAAEGVREAELSVALVGDAAISALNARYLAHEGPTDVISFALHEPGDPPLGDVYLGVEQAARQAGAWGATPAEEVLRLAVHGALHVLGWDHPEADRADTPMYRRQEEILADFLARVEAS